MTTNKTEFKKNVIKNHKETLKSNMEHKISIKRIFSLADTEVHVRLNLMREICAGEHLNCRGIQSFN